MSPSQDGQVQALEVLTEQQVAEELNVTTRTLQRWRNSGDGPPFIRLGVRGVRYTRGGVRGYLAGRTYQHRAGELANKAA